MRPRVDIQDASDALDVGVRKVPLDGQDGAQVAFAGKESIASVQPGHQRPCPHSFPCPQTPGLNQ